MQGRTIDKDLRASANVASRHILKKISGLRSDVTIRTGVREPRDERDMVDEPRRTEGDCGTEPMLFIIDRT